MDAPILLITGSGDPKFKQSVNPIGSALHYISQVLVSRRPWTHDLSYLAAPVVVAVLVLVVVVAAGPRLVRLTAGSR